MFWLERIVLVEGVLSKGKAAGARCGKRLEQFEGSKEEQETALTIHGIAV